VFGSLVCVPERAVPSQASRENYVAMVALYFMYYDFGRVHQTLCVTLAMEAGIADHVWSIEKIVQLLSLGKRRSPQR
jgi:hypothetical protein